MSIIERHRKLWAAGGGSTGGSNCRIWYQASTHSHLVEYFKQCEGEWVVYSGDVDLPQSDRPFESFYTFLPLKDACILAKQLALGLHRGM